MAGTVVVDAVKSSTTGAPTFQNTSGTEIGTLCRAWVNFNGTGVVAIRASFNVSSITDNGTGDYTINFTNAMPDVNYAVSGAGQRDNGVEPGLYYVKTLSTSSVRMVYGSGSFNPNDQNYAMACVFR